MLTSFIKRFLLIASCALVVVANATVIPPGGTSLIAADSITGFTLNPHGGSATRRTVNVADGPGFTQAVEIAISDPGPNFWSIEHRSRNVISVQQGGVALVHFWMRGIKSQQETGEVFVQVYSQRAGTPYNKALSVQMTAGAEWREIFLPFEFDEAYTSNGSEIVFGLGGGTPQTLQLGGIEAVYYGNSLNLDDLPDTPVTYAGREPDAAWRAEAAGRIEQHRKGDLRIRVVDANGLPVPDADIEIAMRKHAFHFGSVVQAWRIMRNDAENRAYRAMVTELFNASGPENALKWPAWDGEWGATNYGQSQTLSALRRLRQAGLHVRGHVLVWPAWPNLPNALESLNASNSSAVPDAVDDHIREILASTDGLLDEWDALNEAVTNHDLMDLFGDQVMVDWFNVAAQAAPGVPFFINDYGILSNGGLGTAKQDAYAEIIEYLLENDAPLGGIGLQGHFGETLTPPTRLWTILERFATYGLPIRVTEFDVDSDDEQLQADYLRDFMTLLFSHPGVVGIQMWGFWENAHWRPQAALYRADWSEKPNGTMYRQLVQQEWWTNADGNTDADGRFGTRAFFGDYDVMATAPGGESVAAQTTFNPDSDEITVTIATLNQLPALNAALSDSGNSIHITWFGASGFEYRMESGPDPDGPWADEGDWINGADADIEGSFATSGNRRFFRINIR